MSIKTRISYGISYFVGFTFYMLCRFTSRLGRITHGDSIHSPPVRCEGIGVSVIIPERDNPALLKTCVDAVLNALAQTGEPFQLIVVANGTPASHYLALKTEYPAIEWEHEIAPLGFSSAIRRGLKRARYEWVFLLNNDMRVDPDCLQALFKFRSPDTFSIASQIFFEDSHRRREETGLTGIRIEYDDVHLFDREPVSSQVVEHFYSGGGASLFRKSLLQQFICFSHSYDPFYWEDVDWGVRANLVGYKNLFVPSAKAWHLHRATVGRFYTPEQVQHIFSRNKWIFYLRFGLQGVHFFWLGRHLRDTGCTRVSVIKDLVCDTFSAGIVSSDLKRTRVAECIDYRFPISNPSLPWLLLIVPFAVYPAAHGAAVRQRNLYRQIAQYFNIWLISDEASSYAEAILPPENPFSVISLLKSPRIEAGNGRLARMSSHARVELYQLTKNIVDRIQPAVIQVEHEELCELVRLRQEQSFWAITLHDVNLGVGPDAQCADEKLLQSLLSYDAIFTCSLEDSRLLTVPNYCIENGVDPQRFHYSAESVGQTLIFVGAFRYLPNRQGIETFIDHLWQKLRKRYPHIKLQILAGLDDSEAFIANNPHFQLSGIEFVNKTDRVQDFLHGATLMVNPLTDIRGSCLKTIEAIACGRVCVSTRDAARGLEEYQFSGLKVVENWEEFFMAISFYLDNDVVRRREETPDDEKLQRFFWNGIGAQQCAVYDAKVNAR